MAGQHGDQSVARLGIERDRAQQRASPEPPDETRAVELVISLRDRAGVSDSFGKGSADDFRRKLRAAGFDLIVRSSNFSRSPLASRNVASVVMKQRLVRSFSTSHIPP